MTMCFYIHRLIIMNLARHERAVQRAGTAAPGAAAVALALHALAPVCQ